MKNIGIRALNCSPKSKIKLSIYKRILSRIILKGRRERNLNLLYARLKAILPRSTKVTEDDSRSKEFLDHKSCNSSALMVETSDLPKGSLQGFVPCKLEATETSGKLYLHAAEKSE
ncbi:hypothetical protein SUGI_0792970 [Cryptomeria japonica]|uniref:uncharacterized protein LOC131074179 isoform X2 n=1 Tax=Cryptomeria japonica TaxID=3369 RepID=UPI0024149227|nr:uncharacterized protein LOC131074179 isoform X2 [Cryptomeria japonica]GLJ38898.1 hypothetical protein SUGI_0792970 [Cryptomeria japonica]